MNEIIKKDINRKCENAYEIKIKALQEKIKRLEYENKQLIVDAHTMKITSEEQAEAENVSEETILSNKVNRLS